MEFSRKMQQQDTQKKRGPAKVLQLPLWPEAKRGVPNAVLRGALFPAIQGKNRVGLLRKELIATQDGVTIRYTGWQLDQADLDVWEHALHLARTQALGTKCYFTAHSFLKDLGRQTGKSGHDWLAEALDRLSATSVTITDGRRTYFGSLIEEGVRAAVASAPQRDGLPVAVLVSCKPINWAARTGSAVPEAYRADRTGTRTPQPEYPSPHAA